MQALRVSSWSPRLSRQRSALALVDGKVLIILQEEARIVKEDKV
jgi:hypothetical protein